MLVVDGARGEGGGQVLRTALTASVHSGQPFRIVNIRAHRRRPGLLAQHLTAVRAAAAVGAAAVAGAERGSRELLFRPSGLVPGDHHFDVGTAGSACLVLQTVLPVLLAADAPSSLTVTGGTHNPAAPPFEFLDRVYAAALRRAGADLALALDSIGFAPRGGGRISARTGRGPLGALALEERGPLRAVRARAVVSRLPRHIAERELAVVRDGLGALVQDGDGTAAGQPVPLDTAVDEVDAGGPGNVLLVEVEAAHTTELFTGFGRRGVPAEEVARGALEAARRWLDAGVPVGVHLADQLLVPLALGAGGTYRTLPPTSHLTTNADVLRRFGLQVRVTAEGAEGKGVTRVEVAPRSG